MKETLVLIEKYIRQMKGYADKICKVGLEIEKLLLPFDLPYESTKYKCKCQSFYKGQNSYLFCPWCGRDLYK